MATVTILGTTVFTTAAGAKTITATPALGDVLVIIGANTGNTTAGPPTVTDNNTDGHGNYSAIVSATKNSSADSMFAVIRADPVRKAVSTVFTYTPGATDTGGGFAIFKITGLTLVGPAAVRQSAAQNNGAAAATPTPTFTNAALTANACLSAVFNATNTSTMTAPTSWTADTDQGYNTPTSGYRAAFRSSGTTTTTVTWGSTSASAFCAVALEISVAQGNILLTNPPVAEVYKPSVSRGAFFCMGEKWARRGRLWVPAPGRALALA